MAAQVASTLRSVSASSSGRAAGPGAMPNVATMPASLSAAVTFGVARHFSSDGDNRFSLRFRQSRDAARYLAVRRLPVDRPFAGDDDIGPRARLACMQQIEHQLDAGAHGRVEQAQHAAAGAARRARARLICYFATVQCRDGVGEPAQTAVEQCGLFRDSRLSAARTRRRRRPSRSEDW